MPGRGRSCRPRLEFAPPPLLLTHLLPRVHVGPRPEPRSLLTRYAPRTPAPELQPFTSISHPFGEFRHTAWRLETRRGYASDRNSPKWERWQAGEDIVQDPAKAWREKVAEQTEAGKRFEHVRLVDDPPTDGSPGPGAAVCRDRAPSARARIP